MTSFSLRATSLARKDIVWVSLAGAALALIVFLSQNRVVGWEPGYNELQPGHHGWVSSHTLAIIAHATAPNRFVGYALAIADQQGNVDYDYFDRTPVFFSSGMHALLSFWPRLSTKVYLAKQAMNGVFLLTVLTAFALVRSLTGRTLAAAVVALLAVSSRYLLFYKDMVHFDQPALLGMLLLMYAIARFALDGRRWLGYGLALVAVSLGGQGFAPLSVVAVWSALEVVRTVRASGSGHESRLRRLASLDSLRILLLGSGWAAANLLYNIQAEAVKRGVPIVETSIVQSAFNRLALNPDFNEAYVRLLDWPYFVSDQLIRMVRWIFPIWNYEGSAAVSAAIVLAIVAVVVRYGRSLDSPRRMVLAVMAVSGAAWLFVLRNLSAFHDYTALYYLGLSLAFYASLTSFVRIPRAGWVGLVFLSLALFSERNLRTQAWHVEIGSPTSAYTHDLMNIAAVLPGPGQFIYWANGVPDAPYAPGFYLPDDFIAPATVAEFSISRDPNFLPGNLTPNNSRLFLFPDSP